MTMVVWPHRPRFMGNALEQAGERQSLSTPSKAITMERKMRIVMAGGGTGGHLYPGLAVAEALEAELADKGGVELIWAATPRQVDKHLLSGFGERYVAQPVQPLIKDIRKVWGFWRGWSKSCAYWKAEFKKRPVDAVLALGGYAAGPAAYVAAQQGIPVGLLNPDAVPGLANRFLLKRAQRVFSQWPLDEGLVAKMGGVGGGKGKVMALGCPIRLTLAGRTREEGAARLGLEAGRPTLVVCGGSLAAKTINDAMMALLLDANVRAALVGNPPSNEGVRGDGEENKVAGGETHRRDADATITDATSHGGGGWQIIHLAGTQQAADVKKAYEPITDVSYRVLDYCDDMASVWAVADLAIARAGASTCAELLACGVPSILLPYPYHRDQHQRHNAEELVQAEAAVLVEDQKDAAANARSIKTPLISLLYDEVTRRKMAVLARSAGKPEAARAIALELLSLVGNQKV